MIAQRFNTRTKIAISAALCAALIGGGYALAQKGPAAKPQSAPVASHKAAAKITTDTFKEKPRAYVGDNTTQVLIDAPKVSADQIVKIIKHGDHWHVFTKDGREIITYTDPTKAKNAGQLQSTSKVVSKNELKKIDPNTVVKLLKHGDHWHIFTAGGQEYVSYTDPRPFYPNAYVGTYEGNHAALPGSSGGNGGAGGGTTHQTNHPSGGNAGGAGTTPSVPGLNFVQVVSLEELAKKPIVKILQHGDHYHAYTADGTEYITYGDPRSIFPHITIGTYEGNHGTTPAPGGNPAPEPAPRPIPDNPNDPKRVVRIQKHGDHWHIHHADGTESITHTDPAPLYPHIKIEEYDENHGHHFEPLNPDEKLNYDDVEAKLIVPLEKITYGNVIHTSGFDRENQRFIIPHFDHYHYVSIETIIQFCKVKDPSFSGYSARDVVATLKYLIEHPEARPEGHNGWGKAAKPKPKPAPAPGGGTGGTDETPDAPKPDKPKKLVRIVQENKKCWVLYYDNGSTWIVFKNPAQDYPNVKIEKFDDVPNAGMTAEEITNTYAKKYGMTIDEFEDRIIKLPYSALQNIKFNDDGTVVIHGKTYVFKKL